MSDESAPTGDKGAESGAAKKRRTFYFRLLSTVVLWALVAAAAVFSQEWIYFVIVEAIVLVSVWEFFRMAQLPRMGWRVPMVIGISGIYLGCLFWPELLPEAIQGWGAVDAGAFVVLLFALFLGEMTRAPESPDTLRRVSLSLFGFVWLVFLFGFVVKLLVEGGEAATARVLYLLVVTKFTDMGAYLTGSIIGKHKFMPHISPKKTWEGIAGGLVFAIGGSYGIVALFGKQMPEFEGAVPLVLALVLGVTAVIGDLAESVVKRSLHTKDSGHALPGIGGTIDLIDSICFTAPVLYFALRFV
jgi:phosphatidate cytidylyltransferase